MIGREELEQIINEYVIHNTHNRRRAELADMIGCSVTTINRVCRGKYAKNRQYSNHPTYNRMISNQDFSLVRELFCNTESMD